MRTLKGMRVSRGPAATAHAPEPEGWRLAQVHNSLGVANELAMEGFAGVK
jgi:hypothetical protein